MGKNENLYLCVFFQQIWCFFTYIRILCDNSLPQVFLSMNKWSYFYTISRFSRVIEVEGMGFFGCDCGFLRNFWSVITDFQLIYSFLCHFCPLELQIVLKTPLTCDYVNFIISEIRGQALRFCVKIIQKLLMKIFEKKNQMNIKIMLICL